MKHFIFLLVAVTMVMTASSQKNADLIIYNGKVATMTRPGEFEQAVAMKDGIILAVGSSSQILSTFKNAGTKVVDAKGKTVIPGLNDSHHHAIREGLNYNSELRWDGITSLKRAMAMLKEQAARTPDGVWIKVVGGWNEFQFEEKRLPTLEEINAAVPDKPVYITYLYGKAFLNKKGIEVLGYNKDTKYDGSLVELDENGNPTGMLYAKTKATAIYMTLGLTTKLSHEERINSTQQYYRELNRLGLTSVIDAGGGSQNYPDDYSVALELAKEGKLTLRTAYYLYAQVSGREMQDYRQWLSNTKLNNNDNMFMVNGYLAEGAGESLVISAADFENFLEPRIVLSDSMESDLEPIITLLVKNRWPFRIHATYGESINRMLNVFEKVNAEIPFNGLRWFFDHAETITDAQMDRVKNLGGGIAVQCRLFYQGELYKNMYGEPTGQIPPIRKMLEKQIPVGLGTDATRVSTFNPWMSLCWAVTGKTIGGYQFWPAKDTLSRFEALQLYTNGSAWFSGEEKVKGKIEPGQYADLAIFNQDYFSIPVEQMKNTHALMTIVNGKVVYAEGIYQESCPAMPEIIPSWSPVKFYSGF